MKYEIRTTPRLRSGQANHGFTLIELITVIIIIGIMLGVALPKYMQLSEKTKASNAKQIMDMLRKAEEAYYIEASTYTAYSSGGTEPDQADIISAGGMPHSKLSIDGDWDYGVVGTSSNTYTVTAARTGGTTGTDGVNGKLMSWIKDDSIRYCSSAGCSSSSEDAGAKKNWK